jgi:hypothetical protein
VIYFIENQLSGRTSNAIKIGYAAEDAEQRRRLFQTGSPDPLVILGTIEGSVREEKRLHRKLARHRRRGEWFDANDDVRAEMERLIGVGAAKPALAIPRNRWELADSIASEVLTTLSPFTLRRLCLEVAMTAEKSYRRGYQHGFIVAGRGDRDSPLARSIAEFRMDYNGRGGNRTKAPYAPEPRRIGGGGGISTVFDRAEQSAGTIGAHLVTAIIRSAYIAGRESVQP